MLWIQHDFHQNHLGMDHDQIKTFALERTYYQIVSFVVDVDHVLMMMMMMMMNLNFQIDYEYYEIH